MNKRIILLPALLLAASSLVFTGCSKDDDTTAPIITLTGGASTEIELQEAYVEQGASAVDGEDGTIAVSITGVVNNNLKGQYIVFYSATDKSGNTGTAERTVNVVNSADFLGGNYVNATDTCVTSPPSSFNATVSVSNTTNGLFSVSNFGAFGTSVSVELSYNSATSKITAVIPQGLGGGANLTNVFTSSAVTSNNPVIYKVNYQWTDSNGISDICGSTYIK